MPHFNQALLRLIARPLEDKASSNPQVPRPLAAPLRAKLTVAQQKRLAQQLWKAVEKNDDALLKEALDQGGDPQPLVRNDLSLLVMALDRNQWQQVDALVGAGARFSNQPGYYPWGVIIKRDDVREADRLLALGAPEPNILHFIQYNRGGHRLFAWGLEQGFTTALPSLQNKHSQDGLYCVLREALNEGSLDTLRRLTAHYHVPSKGPFSLEHHCSPSEREALHWAWEPLFEQDQPTQAQRAFANGWGWAAPDVDVDVDELTGLTEAESKQPPLSFGWKCVQKKAWNLLAWWHSEPDLLAIDQTLARAYPLQTWVAAAKNGWPSFKQVMPMIADFSWVDEAGNTLLHHIVVDGSISKELMQFFIKEHPTLFHQPNAQGHTPLAMLGQHTEQAKLGAFVQRALLEQGIRDVRTSEGPSTPTRRTRL